MTWQRIDENTYIDDTLVTCAEYQLFIDEMRKQGKYYQPDHWTSYQFPKGKALEPILGVRFSDVVAFCRWLTMGLADDWYYRLPTNEETKKNPITSIDKISLGYWVEGDYQFAWIGFVPEDARALDENLLVDLPIRSVREAIIRSRARAFDPAFARDLRRRYDLDLDYAIHFEIILNIILTRELNHVRDFDRALVLTRNLDTDLGLPFFGKEFQKPTVDLTLAYEHVSDLYVDIFTLQERIAGRSPVFEGIRLVKEKLSETKDAPAWLLEKKYKMGYFPDWVKKLKVVSDPRNSRE